MLLKEHSRDPRLCALLQAMVGVQERYGFRVVVGHTWTRFMGDPDRRGRAVQGRAARAVSTTAPWGWRGSRGVGHWVQQAACDAFGTVHGSREASNGVQQWFSGGCPQSCLSLDALWAVRAPRGCACHVCRTGGSGHW